MLFASGKNTMSTNVNTCNPYYHTRLLMVIRAPRPDWPPVRLRANFGWLVFPPIAGMVFFSAIGPMGVYYIILGEQLYV